MTIPNMEENNKIEERNNPKNNILPASILVAAVLISGSVIYAVGVFNSGGRTAKPNTDSGSGIVNAFMSCYDSGKYAAQVQKDTADAQALGVGSTPTTFVNDQEIKGAFPYPQFQTAIENALKSDKPSTKEIFPRDVILGDPKAPVTLIEYGDYQCPFCSRFFKDTEPLIRKNYIETGKVKMVFRNFQFLGSESVNAAQAAECAKDQGKFWVYHDALYAAELEDGRENNGNLKRELFIDLAKSAGLDAK